MNLPRDFDETARRIKVLALFILCHRFNHRVGQAFAAEIIQGVFNELPSESVPTELGRDREVRNAAFPGFAIH